MNLSIVATLYQSSPHISEFYERVSTAARLLVGDDYEIIFVNDGSPDNSLERAILFTEHDHHVVVVDLSRNFGHHRAMMTGLSYAKGQRIFLIDSDLEEDPELMGDFFLQIEKYSCDVVFGVQGERKGGWFERWSGQLFYYLFNLLTGLSLPKNMVTARLMTKRYVDALLRHEEREVFMGGLFHITGFDQRCQVIKKHNTSDTTYTFRKKLSLMINSIASFSNVPLIGIFYIGISISFLSLIYIAYLALNWIFIAKPISGWTSVISSIWLIGGMIISFIGVVGVYLSKIFLEVKQRPYSIVKHIYSRKKD